MADPEETKEEPKEEPKEESEWSADDILEREG